MAIYLTGDTHRDFGRIAQFCEEYETTKDDILIILGDAGINIYGFVKDRVIKNYLAEKPITIFCIHGNHEERPYLMGDYEEVEWHGGIAYMEADYPNLIFAKDGEIYDFNGKKAIAIGGAYSIDKYYRLAHNLPWFESEQADEATMAYVEAQLDKCDWKVDYVLSHTVPIEYEPTWAFIPGIDQSRVDKTMEKWLQRIAENLEFERWYAGHYHVESDEDGVRIMFEDYEELGED
ncbi:MAG: metallophosphoesterase [Lachnospiraceae bacterium]|nr:metallophosphoesterase [Lachnospiraceae bacterium]